MKRYTFRLLAPLAFASLLISCGDSQEVAAAAPVKEDTKPAAPVATSEAPAAPVVAAKVEVNPAQLGVFAALPAVVENPDNPVTDAKVALGRMLYYDKRLSADNTVSCNSCHDLASFGDDGAKNSSGIKGQHGGRSAPTVYNAALHLSQFWDGRAKDVEEQAKGPVLNPIEMGMTDGVAVIAKLKAVAGYPEKFAAAFPGEADSMTYDNLGKAIGAFERKLLTPGRFEKFLAGDQAALTDDEKRGLNAFLAAGCTVCHNGAAVGGALYQKVGLVKPWPGVTDKGRSAITNNPAEDFFFKVPSLRNITETAPYGHDGRVATIEEMVKMMAEHQLGKMLSDDEVKDIVTFLKALKGEIDQEYIKEPALP